MARLFVISGPSGAGKGTLIAKVVPQFPDLSVSVSATTRDRRAGEMEGREYFFIGRERFLRMIEQGEFLEWAEYSDNLYGTPTAAVSSWLAGGTDVILEIELQGARQIRRRMPEAVLIFIAPPGIEELEQRLRLRNTESEESIVRRLTHAEDEMSGLKTPGNGGNGSWGHPEFDYVIVNDDVEKAARDLHGVIYEIRSQDPMR